MRNLPILKAQLRRHEGLRFKPYKDTVGKLTIGVGRNLDDKGISEQEADFLLENDIQDACIDASTLPGFDSAGSVRQCVLVNMVFNMGIYRVRKFSRMLAAVALQNWHEAAEQMLSSLWADQVGDRAKELAEQMRTGQWQKT